MQEVKRFLVLNIQKKKKKKTDLVLKYNASVISFLVWVFYKIYK